ncbi:MAG: zinc ribbon domain-containing protein, partial [Dehalococcoidia bacterium]
MKCTKCEFENPEDADFCVECGAPVEFYCPQCGAATPATGKFCKKCGQNLQRKEVALPVDLSFEDKLEKIQRYLPDGLTEKILAQRGKIEGERKQVTVMFCDAEGFSQISEKLGPEKVYSIMDEVFEILIHKVHEYGGTVNKMTGDGIMALFGAPIALEDAPQRAIRSALAIQRDISRLSDRKKEETGNRHIRMRIGIHTGPVVVGSLGNDLRVEFTAVGDTVNLASRMEGLAEPGTVYVTEDTF